MFELTSIDCDWTREYQIQVDNDSDSVQGSNNALSLDMTEPIYYLICPKFSQFHALPGHFEKKQLKVIKFFFRFQGNLSKK